MIRRLEVAHRRGRPGGRRVLDRAGRSSSTCSTSAILVIGGSYVLVRLGPDRPRGRLRGEPAARPRRRPAAGHLHAAQRQPAAEALARGPQPDDAARRACPAGRSRLGRRSERSWLIRAPLTRRGHFRIEPLHIRTGDPFGFFEASATVGPGRLGRRLPAARAAARVAAAGGQPRGQPRRRPSGRSRRRRSRRRSGPTRRATA